VTLTESIRAFFDSGAGQAALAVLAVGLVDFLLGVLAALRDGVFELSAVGAWIRVQFAGRILPIWILLFIGFYAQGIEFADIPLLLAAGLGAAATYVAETVGSILKNWGPKHEVQTVPTE